MKEAQESKCQNLKCKARGKALSLKCHFFLFSLVYIGFKQFQILLHNFYIFSFCMASHVSSPPHSKFFKFQTSDCNKLGNVHSLQMAMYQSYIKLIIFLMSIQLYEEALLWKIALSSLVWVLAQNCWRSFLTLICKKWQIFMQGMCLGFVFCFFVGKGQESS